LNLLKDNSTETKKLFSAVDAPFVLPSASPATFYNAPRPTSPFLCPPQLKISTNFHVDSNSQGFFLKTVLCSHVEIHNVVSKQGFEPIFYHEPLGLWKISGRPQKIITFDFKFYLYFP